MSYCYQCTKTQQEQLPFVGTQPCSCFLCVFLFLSLLLGLSICFCVCLFFSLSRSLSFVLIVLPLCQCSFSVLSVLSLSLYMSLAAISLSLSVSQSALSLSWSICRHLSQWSLSKYFYICPIISAVSVGCYLKNGASREGAATYIYIYRLILWSYYLVQVWPFRELFSGPSKG